MGPGVPPQSWKGGGQVLDQMLRCVQGILKNQLLLFAGKQAEKAVHFTKRLDRALFVQDGLIKRTRSQIHPIHSRSAGVKAVFIPFAFQQRRSIRQQISWLHGPAGISIGNAFPDNP